MISAYYLYPTHPVIRVTGDRHTFSGLTTTLVIRIN